MAIATSGTVLVGGSELRTHTSLLLEAIALQHQIAVLERSRTRRPCLRRFDRLLWILLSRWWPQWRESLMIFQAENRLALTVALGSLLVAEAQTHSWRDDPRAIEVSA